MRICRVGVELPASVHNLVLIRLGIGAHRYTLPQSHHLIHVWSLGCRVGRYRHREGSVALILADRVRVACDLLERRRDDEVRRLQSQHNGP